MTDTGSTTIQLLEHTYDAARANVPDLPTNVAFVLQGTGRKRGGTVLGHYAPGRYLDADASKVHEIMISGDTLSRGPVEVLTTVLHEAAHALADVRGIKDTSRQNRYHNRRFLALAEELTLSYDQPENYVNGQIIPSATLGFSNVGVTSETIDTYANILVRLTNDMPLLQGSVTPPGTPPKRYPHTFAVFYHDPEQLSVRRLSSQAYEGLKDFLAPHVVVTTLAEQALVESVLRDCGYVLDKEVSAEYRYDLADIDSLYPELITLAEELNL